MLGLRSLPLSLLALLLAAGAPTGRALADDARAEAKRLKDRGAALLDEGKYQDALDQFQAAYRAFPSPNLRFNLGLALAKLGRDVDAVRSFEAFLDEAKDAPESAKTYARREVADLDARVGRVAIAASLAGGAVTIDGAPVGETPLVRPVPVAPGAHEVTVAKEGFEPWHARVDVRAGTVARAEATLAEKPAVHPLPTPVEAAAAQPTPAPEAATPVYKKWWLWTIVGVVVAGGAAVGVGVGVAASQGPDCSQGLGCWDLRTALAPLVAP